MGLLVLVGLAGLALGGFRAVGTKRATLYTLTDQALELEIEGEAAFRNLLLGLRSYHYRAQRQAVTTLREFYYDTDDWSLVRRGYSCRLVERLTDDGTAIYAIEVTRDAPGKRAFEVVSQLSVPVGQLMTAGSWDPILSAQRELPAVRRLREVLQEFEIEEENLGVRGVGEVTINHFDITDKGRRWFELDYEQWIFSAFGAEDRVAFRWYGIALRPIGDPPDEEFLARVKQMEDIFPTFYRFQSEVEPRLVRAVGALGRP